MMPRMKLRLLFLAVSVALLNPSGAQEAAVVAAVTSHVDRLCPDLLQLYKHWHEHPELSLAETQTAARLAEELRQSGCAVTPRVGDLGVVALLTNGPGPTVLVRADMDALPVKEQTGLSYASTVTARDQAGNLVPVMHACGHDMHMACLVGTARVLVALKDRWRGTVVLLGQPAEEVGDGAKRVLADGLFRRFPRPDYGLALHVSADLPAGVLGYTPGFSAANVDTVDITVRGLGGHGAHPDKTKDPVVLTAQIVLALQTIVSREVDPTESAVVTVGSIHGGTKHNIIPDEVKLQLTVRTYAEEVRRQVLAAIPRIARGQAEAAGVPEDRLPLVQIASDYTPAVYNDPALTQRLAEVFKGVFGETHVLLRKPSMGGEDFGEYGRTPERIPICMFSLGAVGPEAWEASRRDGSSLPGLHSPRFAPAAEPTLKTGVRAMSLAVLALTARP